VPTTISKILQHLIRFSSINRATLAVACSQALPGMVAGEQRADIEVVSEAVEQRGLALFPFRTGISLISSRELPGLRETAKYPPKLIRIAKLFRPRSDGASVRMRPHFHEP
jgi:hypothetical protein